jgi:hypothetical protein
MNFKKLGIVLFLIFSFLPISKALAQTTTNAGFVPGNIWYSKDPFEEGDKIKIYTLIFNPDTSKFSGTVDFFDNSTLLGSKDFTIAATSTKDISINWTVTAGDHQIFGQIENAKIVETNGTSQNVTLSDNVTTKSSRTVSNKIIAQNIDAGINTVDGSFNATINSIQNIGDNVKNTLPTSLSQSVTTTTNTIDGLRVNAAATLQDKQTEAQSEINSLNSTSIKSSKNPTSTNDFQKPFAYIELFFFSILTAIFKYKIIFYGIIVIAVFVILRYIWYLIF